MSYTLYSANTVGTNANGNSGAPRNQCAGVVANNGSFPLTRADGTPLQLGDWVTVDPTATFPFSIDGVVFTTREDTARFINVGVWVSNVSFYQQTNSLPVANKITESINGNSATQQAINQEFKQEILDLKVRSIRNVGYCGTTQPSQAMSGDIWYQTNASSPYGSDLPTSFPIQVYLYENNAWSSTTQNWEPNDNDLIINTNINIAFVWNGGWSPNNQSLSTTDDTTINRNSQGQLQVIDGGITLAKIATDAIADIKHDIPGQLYFSGTSGKTADVAVFDFQQSVYESSEDFRTAEVQIIQGSMLDPIANTTIYGTFIVNQYLIKSGGSWVIDIEMEFTQRQSDNSGQKIEFWRKGRVALDNKMQYKNWIATKSSSIIWQTWVPIDYPAQFITPSVETDGTMTYFVSGGNLFINVNSVSSNTVASPLEIATIPTAIPIKKYGQARWWIMLINWADNSIFKLSVDSDNKIHVYNYTVANKLISGNISLPLGY